MTERALGIDTSHWDGNWDAAKAKQAGASFVYVKASQGTWTDPMFVRNWQAAKDAGLLRGAYCYLDWGWSELKQAEVFVKALAGDWGELPPCLDLEMNPAPYGLTAALVSGKAWNFLKYVENATGRVPMMYHGYYYWNSWGNSNIGWTHFPLWLPWYASEWWIKVCSLANTGTGAPKPWKGWTFWQKTDRADGSKYGCQSEGVDEDYFNGTVDDLRKFASAAPLPAPLPPTALGQYRVLAQTLKVFTGPSDTYKQATPLKKDQPVNVIAVLNVRGEQWAQIGLARWCRLAWLVKI